MDGFKLEVERMERSHTPTWTVKVDGVVMGLVTTREKGEDGHPVYKTTYHNLDVVVSSDELHGGEFGNINAVQEIVNKARR
jgi:hypothetical protein